MNLHFGNPTSIKSVADAVPLYGTKEFESATRSTVPMLSLLMHAPDLFNEIVRRLGFPDNSSQNGTWTYSSSCRASLRHGGRPQSGIAPGRTRGGAGTGA
jgi:hypothetical protein